MSDWDFGNEKETQDAIRQSRRQPMTAARFGEYLGGFIGLSLAVGLVLLHFFTMDWPHPNPVGLVLGYVGTCGAALFAGRRSARNAQAVKSEVPRNRRYHNLPACICAVGSSFSSRIVTMTPLRLAIFSLALLALPVAAAEPALPQGAKARFGSFTLRDSQGWIGAVLAPDGKHLVMVQPKGLFKYDVATGDSTQLIKEIGGFDRRIEFSGDGSRFVTLSFSAVHVRETATGKVLAEVKRPVPFGEGAASLAANGKVLAIGGAPDFNAKDKPVTALVWDVEKNEKIREVTVVQNQSASVALAPDGKLLVTWGTHFDRSGRGPPEPGDDPGRTVQLWDVAGGKEIAKFAMDAYGIPRVAFTPDGQTMALSSGAGSIRLIDTKTGAVSRRLFARSDQGVRLAFSPDGKLLATAGNDSVIQLWNVKDGTRAGLVDCPAQTAGLGVQGIVFTAPDRAVAFVSLGSTAIVWEVPSGKLLSPLAGHVGPIRSVAFSPDGKEVLTGADDGLVIRWEIGGKEIGEVPMRMAAGFSMRGRYPMMSVHVSPDGRTASLPNGQAIFELPSGRQIASTLAGSTLDLRTAATTDARLALLVPSIPFPPKPVPKTIRIPMWDIESGSKLCELEAPPGDVGVAATTPDRKTLITTMNVRLSENKSEFHCTAWELASGKKLGDYSEPGGYGPAYIGPLPDNKTALVFSPSNKLQILDLSDGKSLKEIDTNRRGLTAAPVFAPGGKQFAIAITAGFGDAAASEIRIYETEGVKLLGTFRGHAGSVSALAFSADGKLLLSGGYDTTAVLWDVAAAKSE
jgi:WD40 repeat protein